MIFLGVQIVVMMCFLWFWVRLGNHMIFFVLDMFFFMALDMFFLMDLDMFFYVFFYGFGNGFGQNRKTNRKFLGFLAKKTIL